MQQWNKIFKEKGIFFTSSHEDIDYVRDIFEKNNVKKLLDLGCGSGRHIIYFTRKGFEVHGIDVAKEGIKLVKSWLQKEGLDAKLTLGSIYEKLQYEDNFFDAIISTQVIHHSNIENIRNTIKEIERILKPSGIIFISVTKSKYKQRATNFKKIAPRTYIPIDGNEIGLPHYIYNKELLRRDFKNFKIYKIWVDSGQHYCFVGKLKDKF